MKNKLLLISLAIIVAISILVTSIVTKIEYNKYLEEYNENIYNIIGVLKEKYPEISGDEIITLLNGNKNKEYIKRGIEVLEKYGINSNQETILELKKVYNKSIIINCTAVLMMILLIVICIIIYKFYQKNEINKITQYIKQVNNRNYKLKIEENTEDELTNLRNELYKITLMLREEAENSKKDKLNLATSLSDISHQIKTPLTSISIMLDGIKDNNMEEETKQKFIYEISRQIEQISFLTIALLKLSKLDADAVELKREKVKVNEIIDSVVKNLEIAIEIKNQKIVKNVEDFYIEVDKKWTIEALTNIVKNCIEHTKENKNIYIIARNTNLFVELEIKDEGEGISKEDLKHIFERFYKGKNSKDNSYGIGLALSKSIIEKQNGTIYCKSEEGIGSTFNIKWMKIK